MWPALGLCALVGCGRIGFDSHAIVRGGDDGAASDGVTGDGTVNVCGTTICGDGCCAGTDGEMCVTCPADCATTNPVCGNGACDPGEISETCYADCGPSPWPWTADEAALLVALNNARTSNNTQCNGAPMPAVPALVASSALQPASREWAWEIAHQQYFGVGGCNGRDTSSRILAGGATSAWGALGSPTLTPAGAVMDWIADTSACPDVMSATKTDVGLAAAHDAYPNVYWIMLK